MPSLAFSKIPVALAAGGLLAIVVVSASARAEKTADWPMVAHDPVKTELVMQLVVTCSNPERVGGGADSKDGKRTEIWPIIGGRFQGKGIRGIVVPGGGDFPVLRPDGVEVIDALYRLKTDDGVTIIIHNRGIAYPGSVPGDYRYRLAPEFIAPKGQYEWLNKNLFISTLTEVPSEMRLAKGANQNDRLIQVYRVY